MSTKAIILIQAIDEPLQASFDYALEKSLKAIEQVDFFACDSLSDQSVGFYLKEMIKEKEEVCLVFDTRGSSNIGMGQSVLNAYVMSKKIKLLCLGDVGKLAPFMKLFRGEAFASEDLLITYLKAN